MHHAVTVRMAGSEMNDTDLLTVEVDRRGLFEGHDWKGRLRSLGLAGKSLPDIAVGDNDRVLAELSIPSRVIAVPVGVQQELRLAATDLPERLPDAVGQRFELVVDDQDAIGSCRHPDVATGSLQHVDAASHGDVLDDDVGEIPLGTRREERQSEGDRRE